MIELTNFKNSLKGTWIFIFSVWLSLMSFILYIYLSEDLSSEINSLSNLNSVGGILNIVSSLTGIITVYLLVETVVLQKSMSIDMESQFKEQITSSEQSDRINRTLKYIDEWKEVRSIDLEEVLPTESKSFKFVEKIMFLYSSVDDFKEHINFKILSKVIINDDFFSNMSEYNDHLEGDIITQEHYVYEDRKKRGIHPMNPEESELEIKLHSTKENNKKIDNVFNFLLSLK